MSVKTHINENEDKMKLIGGIFTALNRLENGINHVISSAFSNPYGSQEGQHFISSVIADKDIFCKFEEKRLMFKKLIETTDYIIKAKKIDIDYDKQGYLDLAQKIKKVQEIRNKVAHNYILFDKDGMGIHFKQKSHSKLLEEKGKMMGSFNTMKLDLKQAQKESVDLCDEWEKLMGDLMVKIITVFNYPDSDSRASNT